MSLFGAGPGGTVTSDVMQVGISHIESNTGDTVTVCVVGYEY